VRKGKERINHLLTAFIAALQTIERITPSVRTLNGHRFPAWISRDPTLGDMGLQPTLSQLLPGVGAVIATVLDAPVRHEVAHRK
jgi:hypothetical protein